MFISKGSLYVCERMCEAVFLMILFVNSERDEYHSKYYIFQISKFENFENLKSGSFMYLVIFKNVEMCHF